MSNCVTIHNDIVISNRYFDGERLLADIKSYEASSPVCPAWDTDDLTSYYLWWFLGSNNVKSYFRGKAIIISFGYNRSSHTWRDLRGTEHFLARYLKIKEGQTLHCPCRMSDESDGFSTEYDGEVKICQQS